MFLSIFLIEVEGPNGPLRALLVLAEGIFVNEVDGPRTFADSCINVVGLTWPPAGDSGSVSPMGFGVGRVRSLSDTLLAVINAQNNLIFRFRIHVANF